MKLIESKKHYDKYMECGFTNNGSVFNYNMYTYNVYEIFVKTFI